ncbi:hypothetical protein GCM10023205_60470 [Yinghuangia aomiensis]|uniref:DUF5753 domain-containing protein n=1 Tax=Yinghuangia aomiensis TaxID=676205 RepID=A0ABP9I008_9ACTN
MEELWFVIDETALRRKIAPTDVMHEQYEHLLTVCASPYVQIQVLLLAVGPHAGLAGPVSLLDVPGQGTVVYAEGAAGGHLLSRSEDVHEQERRYDLSRADALSHADSTRLIRTILENL